MAHGLDAGEGPMTVDALRIGPLLADLDAEARQQLARASRTLTAHRGEVLFRTGDPVDNVYLVISGKVKLTRRLAGDIVDPAHNRETLLCIIGPGQVFGELSVFDPGPRNTSAVAITATRLRSVSAEDANRLVVEYPELGRAVLVQLARRLRLANERASNLVLQDVSARVATVVLNLAARFGERRGDAIHVMHDLTQSEIASMVGSSRETVNKILTDFAARNWVQLGPRWMIIYDERRLRGRIGSL